MKYGAVRRSLLDEARRVDEAERLRQERAELRGHFHSLKRLQSQSIGRGENQRRRENPRFVGFVQWMSFEQFVDWAYESGYRRGLIPEIKEGELLPNTSLEFFYKWPSHFSSFPERSMLPIFREDGPPVPSESWVEWITENEIAWVNPRSVKKRVSETRLSGSGSRRMREYRRESRRCTTAVIAFGESKSIRAWAGDHRCAVGKSVLSKRLREGWDAEHAISTKAGRPGRPNCSEAILTNEVRAGT